MNKVKIRDRDSGEQAEVAFDVTAENLAKMFSRLFDRSFEASVQDVAGKRIIRAVDKDSGQLWMTVRDIAIVLGKTRKEVYALNGSRARQTGALLKVKPLPLRKMPGSKEQGVLRSELIAWLESLPAPVRISKGRKKRPSRHV
jgi:hypothetical protein